MRKQSQKGGIPKEEYLTLPTSVRCPSSSSKYGSEEKESIDELRDSLRPSLGLSKTFSVSEVKLKKI